MSVIDFIKTVPLGGGYTWDASKPTSGSPKAIIYKGEVILQKDTATYCCGLTFWVWFELYGQHIDIAVSEMKKVQQLWYCARGNRPGCQDALIAINQWAFGAKPKPEHLIDSDIEPGDFLQLWRNSGSGHSVVYTGKNETHLFYWSTQPKTQGVGYRSEPLTAMKELFFVRAKPLEI
jgi:hypothetical protein